MEEAHGQTGEYESQQMEEFMPGIMYMEQILRIMPREFSSKLRMLPAFEETLMKYDEGKGGGDKRQGATGGSASTTTQSASE